MKRIFFLIAFIAATAQGIAQKFVAESTLPVVNKNGFYRVALSPEIAPYLTSEFSNVRILDDQQREVPWLFQEEPSYYYSRQFREYKILEKKSIKNCCTTVILHNPQRSAINNVSLNIRNADVNKHATLLGSDDRTQWYALRQHVSLSAIDNKNNTAELKIVDFPLSNYTYFSIQLDDSTSAPLNILSAGYYEGSTSGGQYTEVPAASQIISDSVKQKKTFIKLTFNAQQVFDKFQLVMEGMPYFQRRASVYSLQQHDVRRGKKTKTETYYEHVLDLQVRSAQPAEIMLNGIKSAELLIVIENDDNPSLRLKSATVSQRNRYATAWLEANKKYVMKFGDATMISPVYDIAFFKDSIPERPEVIRAASILPLAAAAPAAPTGGLFNDATVIWTAIGAVIVILGLLSVRLVRDASKKQPD